MGVRVGLSTASVYPESTAHAFAHAARLGYDAVEVMVGIDALSVQTEALQRLSWHHEMPVCAVHAPCLLITQRVWGTDPWGKLERSAEMAQALGAGTVVVHPPFRWQRDYARGFVAGIAALERRTGLTFAVENMYPWRATARGRHREMLAYQPGWDPTTESYAAMTLDLSHASTARVDSLELARRMGDRLRHVHLTDGTGSAKDEHLVPGRGDQPADALLQHLASSGFDGTVVVEINTRRCDTAKQRDADLHDSLVFAREHLRVPHRA